MSHAFQSLKADDGSWAALKEAWKVQCGQFEEDFDGYAPAAFAELDAATAHPDDSYTVYGLINEGTGEFDAVCSVNWTYLPGYVGKVLRVRNLLFAPKFDFGEFEVSDYATVLTRVFARAVTLAIGARPSRHIKFHLRSPVERQFFALAGSELDTLEEFKTVKIRGAWLYIELA